MTDDWFEGGYSFLDRLLDQGLPLEQILLNVEHRVVLRRLRDAKNVRTDATKALGLSRRAFFYLVQKLRRSGYVIPDANRASPPPRPVAAHVRQMERLRQYYLAKHS